MFIFYMLKNWIIKKLGGYTSAEYQAMYQLKYKYHRKYMEYRLLFGTLENAKKLAEELMKDL